MRKTLPEIVRELDLDTVVEASVFTVGGKVQIRVSNELNNFYVIGR